MVTTTNLPKIQRQRLEGISQKRTNDGSRITVQSPKISTVKACFVLKTHQRFSNRKKTRKKIAGNLLNTANYLQ